MLKPNDEYGGTGVTLGWETDERAWDEAIARALRGAGGGWIAQERIAIRREPFPVCERGGVVERDMLVDFAPYLFRGRVAGFLTRLSATGLANVTSGGGQVPAFVVVKEPDELSTATVFGPFSPELAPGAHNAIDVCLAIQPRERVALIADEASREVAASLAAALEDVGAAAESMLIEQIAARPLTAAPREVLDALERADAGILCVQPAAGRARLAHGHRRGRGAAADPLRAHGRRDAARS